MVHRLSAIIEKDEFGYYASCPELKGCHTQGESFEEALANLQEAAELYLETLTPDELREVASRTIISTSLEVTAYA